MSTATIGGDTYDADTPAGVEAITRRMIGLGTRRLATTAGEVIRQDSYRCVACNYLGDNEDPHDAACPDCDRCPSCAPSVRPGLDDRCHECAGDDTA